MLLAVKSNINSHQLFYNNPSLELVCVSVKLSFNQTLLLGCVYLPPNKPASQYIEFSTVVEELLLARDFGRNRIILLGDFNLPNIDWSSSTGVLNPASQPIRDLANLFHLTQINNVVNDRNVLLDLVFASSQPDIGVGKSIDPLLPVESHHPALEIGFTYDSTTASSLNRIFVFDFRRSNLEGIFDWIQDWYYPTEEDNCEAAFAEFCGSLGEVIKQFTPKEQQGKSLYPRWFSHELKLLVTRKKCLHKQYKITSNIQIYNEFSRVRAQCKVLSSACYKNYISSVENALQSNIKVFGVMLTVSKAVNQSLEY